MKKFKLITVLVVVIMTLLMFTACSSSDDATEETTTETTETTEDTTDDADMEDTDMEESSDDTADSGEKIVYLNNQSEPGSLHPGLAQGTHDSWIIDHCFVGLFEKTEEGVPGMALATDVQVSDDGLNYTITMRDDTLWSNGDPVTANDFITAWMYALNPENGAYYSSMLYIFEGAEEYNSGTGAAEDVKIAAVDDSTIEFTLVNPVPYIEDLMTHYTFLPINTANQEANPDWYKSPDNYVTNGPFTMVEWKAKDEILLDKNENYYDADKVNLDGIHFIITDDKQTEWQLYEDGQLDLVYTALPAVLDQLMAEDSDELTIAPDLATYYYSFNNEKVPFNNQKVRQALSMAIDRTVIVENITKGGQTPAYSMTPPGVKTPEGEDFVDFIGDTFSEDPEGAKALLEEGLAEEGMTIDDFEFSLLYNTNDNHKKIAEAIQQMWNQNLGVQCELENAEFQVVLDRRDTGDYDVVRAGWVGDYADPTTFLDLFVSDSSLNNNGYANPDFDELIAASYLELDPDARMDLLADAERLLIDDMGVLPIYFYSKQIIQKPELTGVFTPINKYPVFTYADINR